MEIADGKIFDIFVMIVLGLISLVYHRHTNDIEELKKNEKECVIHALVTDIAEMKTDIKWIKGKLFNKN